MAATQRHLDAIRKRETWALNASESARFYANLARGGTQAARGKSTSRADSALDAVWRDAEQRVAAEIAANEKVAQEARDAKAKAKAERRAQSIWW
jgi:hypothetical protein